MQADNTSFLRLNYYPLQHALATQQAQREEPLGVHHHTGDVQRELAEEQTEQAITEMMRVHVQMLAS